ncbi:MAG: hypothetical protein BA066_05895 [Candidatus Korarchaeota archaeon NZ13-K]|nr:MAG: hypothetical protein BA066_05895 [Candidatus Korarchaeota archaeon NZ13-K]
MEARLRDLITPLLICLALLIALSFPLDLGLYEVPLLAVPLLALLLLGTEPEVRMRRPAIELGLALLPPILLALCLISPPPYSPLILIPFLSCIFIPLAPFSSRDPWESLGFSFSLSGAMLAFLMLLHRTFPLQPLWIIAPVSLVVSATSVYLTLRGRSLWKDLEPKLDGYIALILLLAFFFLLELALAYPNIFRLTTNDILYHQDRAWELAERPSGYDAWNYLGFHSLLGSVYLITGADSFSAILTVIPMNLIAFLLVASSFSKLRWRGEALFIWSLFTSLGFLAAIRYGTDYNGLDKANEYSYRSLIWSHPIFFWGLPLTLAIGLLAFSLYSDLYVEGRRKIIYIFSSTLFAFLVHVAEALVFAAYLAVASLLLGGRRSSSLAVTLTGLILYSLYLTPGVYRGTAASSSLYLLLAGLLSLALNEARERYLGGAHERLIAFLSGRRDALISILLALYASGLIVWQLHLGEVKVSDIFYLGHVPWFFYPNLIGISGLLAIISLRFKLDRWMQSYALFALTSLLTGRLVTYLRVSGFSFPYWEYRFPLYAALGIAALASPLLRRMLDLSRGSRLWAFLLALLVVTGFSSTALSVQRWNQLNKTASGSILPADFDFAVKESLRGLDRPVLTLSYYSSTVASLMHASSMRQLSPWISEGPEVPLITLRSIADDDIAVLTTLGDVALLNGENATYNYLFMFLGPILSAPSVETIELSEPPSPNASASLILPADTYLRRRSLIAYELIRRGLPPHSIYLSDDPGAPAGVCIGPSSANQTIREEIPSDKGDLRWLYLKGDFSRAENGLRVRGERNLAVTTYELDRGSFRIRVCGDLTGYVGIIYDFRNFRNYRLLQVYLDRGVAVNRIVRDGNVSSGAYIPVPLSWECNEIELRLGDRLEASINGRVLELPRVERLGVLGFETGNFTGVVSGEASGSHSLVWNEGACSLLISVTGGGDVDLADWVDRGLRNLSEAKRAFPGIKINLSGPKQPAPRIEAVITDIKASGEVRVHGRPVWMIRDGRMIYMNMTELELRAEGLEYVRGEGFYADLRLRGLAGMNASEAIVRFRTPVRIEASGDVRLEKYQAFSRSVGEAFNVRTREANLTIMAADRAILLSELEAPREDLSRERSLLKMFDETEYLPEALACFFPLTIAFHYVMKPRRIRENLRRRRGLKMTR